MTQEENNLENTNGRKKREKIELHPAWLKDMFIRPGRTLEKVSEQDKPVWLMPLLVITVMVLLVALIGGPVRKASIEASMQQPPEGFQYWSDADQQAYFQRQQNALSPIFVYIFPFIKKRRVLAALGAFLIRAASHPDLTRQPRAARQIQQPGSLGNGALYLTPHYAASQSAHQQERRSGHSSSGCLDSSGRQGVYGFSERCTGSD